MPVPLCRDHSVGVSVSQLADSGGGIDPDNGTFGRCSWPARCSPIGAKYFSHRVSRSCLTCSELFDQRRVVFRSQRGRDVSPDPVERLGLVIEVVGVHRD